MWAVNAVDLIKRLSEIRDAKDPDDPVERAIIVGIDRAITEICMMDPVKED
ncbi:MAG: hypothetical protein IIY21_00670 [Clostridiales bacterium]|nr:hypothetical protein [Clostridiales bacterium]